MDIVDFAASLTIAPNAIQDPILRDRAIRHAAGRPLAVIDDALVTAASAMTTPHHPIRDYLFQAVYSVCEGAQETDYPLSALTLFAALQVGMRRFVPSGQQCFVQVGGSGDEAFATACANIPFLPASLYALSSAPPESAGASLRRLPWPFRRSAANTPAADTPADAMREHLASALVPSVRRSAFLDAPQRWISGIQQIHRVAFGETPAIDINGRIGLLSLVLLDRPEDYAALITRLRPLLTTTSMVLLSVRTADAEAVAAVLRQAIPSAVAAARVDYHTAVPEAAVPARTLLCLPAARLAPPSVPAHSQIKLATRPEDKTCRLISRTHQEWFAGESITVSPAEQHACPPPLFLERAGGVPEAILADLTLDMVEAPPMHFSRLDGGAVMLGMSRLELLQRSMVRLDPANVAKAPLFPTMVQDGRGNIVHEASRFYDSHHYVIDGPDGFQRVLTSVKSTCHIPGDSVLVYGSEANSHWLFEGLFPLYALESLGVTDPTLIVTHEIQPYQLDMLERLGFGPDRIRRTRTEERLTCDRLFAHDLNLKFGINGQTVAFVETLAAGYPDVPVDRLGRSSGERIYVARTDARWIRRFLNENEVVAALADLGFDIVVPSQLSVPELIATFRRARTIVGPLGAGLLNSIFTPAGADVIAFSAELYYEPHLKRITALKGHRLGMIFGDTLFSDDKVFAGSHSDWVIDVPFVADRLKHHLGL